MKKVIGILALLAMTGNIASAELLKNFKYDGKVEVNTYQTKNIDYNDDATDKVNNTDVRVQINTGFDLNDDASAVVSIVKNDRQHGDASQDVNTITTKLFVEQAYLNLKGVLGFDHKLGRQYYGNEGDLVIYYGPKSWPFTYGGVATTGFNREAIDAYTGWYKTGKWDIHGIIGTVENNSSGGESMDQNVSGIVAKYDLMEDLKLGGFVYRYNAQVANQAGPNDHLDTIGVKADGKFMGIEYGAELAKNMGLANEAVHDLAYALADATYLPNNTTGDYSGMAFKANAKYGIDLMGKLTFMGEYAMGSGDDDNTNDKVENFFSPNSDYRPGALWGGEYLTGLGGAGLDNLTTYNVGAMWNPSKIEKLTIAAKYFHFAPTEEPTGYDVYGNELDLCANWKHSENVGVKAYYAMFMPDSDYAGANDDSTSLLGAAFTVKF